MTDMNSLNHDEIRDAVRDRYGDIAGSNGSCCSTDCCGEPVADASGLAQRLGYSKTDLVSVPAGANLGLGCGNPQAIAALKPGEAVLDLGSGAGFDCFLAARAVGDGGRVIGVDMTPAMLAKARANAVAGGYRNIEFRLGEIERLPVADDSVDVILSNCVINLSPDKRQVFAEAWRVLRPGGRLAISDVVAFAELPAAARRDLALHAGCISGAATIAEIETMLRGVGFNAIRVTPRDESRAVIADWAPGDSATEFVVSATIEAVKPATRGAARDG